MPSYNKCASVSAEGSATSAAKPREEIKNRWRLAIRDSSHTAPMRTNRRSLQAVLWRSGAGKKNGARGGTLQKKAPGAQGALSPPAAQRRDKKPRKKPTGMEAKTTHTR